MNTLILENENLRLEFDRDSGALTGLTAVHTGWQILNRPQLGLSFRLLVPLRESSGTAHQGRDWQQPAPRNNAVHGEKQKLSSLAVDDDGCGATFVWRGVDSEHGGRLDIDMTMTVKLAGGKAIFTMTIENRSPFVVENVYCPYLG